MGKKLLVILILAISLGFILAEKYAIKGSVSSSGSPIKDVDVTLKKVPGYAVFARSMTDGRGNFQFADSPEGNFVVEVSYFPISGPDAEVSGKFYYFDDPLDDAVVKIFNEDNQLLKTINTDDKGRFSANGLDAAEVRLVISGITGYTPAGQ
ncbi:MAG: carboxypeptidase regulatory-like domain-containing protein [Bacteroidetes bacterium]|nr:carboxypeptidase regulatory-like domain-containing protein [Bacteroidota bacterium]MBT5531226.1 carboxypeptidase regulatory-like domain-containing protein [Cytophagia bacterium]MBT3422787.1 carboxypeptidase regulatory-like domain-containing protein [Bacteroidota bacterium]MBT3933067.1 carboxypeptidase regulatory-like domain-containing protein [Bacteroidota bacterium]MBT4338755.1 carboxypeptidase regulatory-like domain-containing protein [Bacteroidota bacterium]